jgi:hypothetical protein
MSTPHARATVAQSANSRIFRHPPLISWAHPVSQSMMMQLDKVDEIYSLLAFSRLEPAASGC